MMHVDEGTLQAFMDGELGPAERADISRHLEGCDECAAALDAARAVSAEFSALAAALDAPAPVERARAELARRTRVARGTRSLPSRRTFLRAAVVVVGFTTLASAALPGSPLRGWAGDAWRQVAGVLEGEPAGSTAVPSAEEPAPATVAVRPVDGRAGVSIQSPAGETAIRVRLGSAERVRVTAPGGAGAPRFRMAPGRVEVVGPGPGPITIVLPHALRRGEVSVDGRPYVRKTGDGLRILAAPVDSLGTELIFRVGP